MLIDKKMRTNLQHFHFICFLVLMILFNKGFRAQNTVLTSGNTAFGGDGSITYSIGQTFYSIDNGINFYCLQGVQQPHEISSAVNIPNSDDSFFQCVAYPNPVTDYLIIDAGEPKSKDLHYNIYAFDGKIKEGGKINTRKTKVDLSNYSSGIYMLKIFEANRLIKIVKIIKSQ